MRGIGFGGLGQQHDDLSSGGAPRGALHHGTTHAPSSPHGRQTLLQPVSSMSTPPRPSPLGFPLASDRSGNSMGRVHSHDARGGGGGSGVLHGYGHRSTGATSLTTGTQQALEWQANLSFVRSAGLLWMSLSISYILMVIAGLYLALSSFDGSLATAALLMVDTGLALIAFITVTFHLARPRNSWPSRLGVSGCLIIFFVLGCATWLAGEASQMEVLIQLSMVALSAMLMGASIILSSWLRTAHLQVADLVESGRLQLSTHQPQQAIGSPAVDVSCGCRWLPSGIPRAWAEGNGSEESQQLVNAHGRGSSADVRHRVITWPVYLNALGDMMFNIDPVLMAHPPRQPSVAPPHHTIHLQAQVGGTQYSHVDHSRPAGFSPSLGVPPVRPSASSPSSLLVPGRRSPQPIVHQLGGVPFYENVPADAPDPSHQYYCPICMLYYGEVYKTHCCMNYMCQECSVVYVSGKRKKAEEAMLASLSLDYDSQAPFMASHIVACPYCQSNSMVLTRVNPWEGIKVYEDDDKGSDRMSISSSCTDPTAPVKVSSKGKGAASKSRKPKVDPNMKVAIGDSFDTLRAKIDFTGFAPQSLPGVAELEPSNDNPSEDSPKGSTASQPVVDGEESGDFAEGRGGGDILLPNQTDFLPKGVERTSGGSEANSRRNSSMPSSWRSSEASSPTMTRLEPESTEEGVSTTFPEATPSSNSHEVTLQVAD